MRPLIPVTGNSPHLTNTDENLDSVIRTPFLFTERNHCPTSRAETHYLKFYS